MTPAEQPTEGTGQSSSVASGTFGDTYEATSCLWNFCQCHLRGDPPGEPVISRTFGDTYEATHNDSKVRIKALRMDPEGDPRMVRKVHCSLHHIFLFCL